MLLIWMSSLYGGVFFNAVQSERKPEIDVDFILSLLICIGCIKEQYGRCEVTAYSTIV